MTKDDVVVRGIGLFILLLFLLLFLSMFMPISMVIEIDISFMLRLFNGRPGVGTYSICIRGWTGDNYLQVQSKRIGGRECGEQCGRGARVCVIYLRWCTVAG